MNDRTRFHRAMDFESVDRVPYWEFLGAEPATVARWRAEGLPAEVHLETHFGLDRLGGVPVDDGLVPPFAEVLPDGHNLGEWGAGRGYPLIGLLAEGARPTLENGALTGRDRSGRVLRERDGRLVEVVSYPLASRADLAALRKRLDPRSPRRYPRHWADFLRCMRGRDYPLGLEVEGPLGRLVHLAGPERTAAFVRDDPAFVDEALEVFTDFAIDLMRPTLAGVGDTDFVLLREEHFAEALGAETYRRLLAPRHERLVRTMADQGVKIIVLLCAGDLSAVLRIMADLGVTAAAPLTAGPHMDPLALRREFGRSLAFIGGIDARALAGDRAGVEREVMQKASALLGAGGWIPSLDRPVPPEVPLDNYRYYWELVRDLAETG